MTTPNPTFAEWRAEGQSLLVQYSVELLRDLGELARSGYRLSPWGGVEIGGVLFGYRHGDKVRILAQRPVPCEHAHGPAFELSSEDEPGLLEVLRLVNTDSELRGLEPMGWYRTVSYREIALGEADAKLYESFFPLPWQVTLIIKRSRTDAPQFGFFVRDPDGSVRTASTSPFTLAQSEPAHDADLFEGNGSREPIALKRASAAAAGLRAEEERVAAEMAAVARAASARAELERIAQERADFEHAELERIAAEKAAIERAEQARIEQERIDRERSLLERAERERAAAERSAFERAAQARAEQLRIAQERAAFERTEKERIAAEKAAREREEQARIEQARIAEERAALQKAERDRLAAEQAAIEKVRAERERTAREAEQARLAAERAEIERVRLEQERARQQAEQEQRERERAEQEQIARDRAAQEQARQEQERAREQAEQERVARQRAEQERIARERAALEQARLEQERAERELAEQARRAAELAALERAEQERIDAETAARERAEQARLEQERRAEAARLEAERAEQERIARERAEAERLETERARAEQERLAREQAERARFEQERIARERVEAEREAAERAVRAEQERAVRERAEQERTAAELAALAQAERARLELDRIARERADQERAAAERAALEQTARRVAEQEQAVHLASQENVSFDPFSVPSPFPSVASAGLSGAPVPPPTSTPALIDESFFNEDPERIIRVRVLHPNLFEAPENALAFFDFQQDPFALSPDPAFLFRSRQHDNAISGLVYGILHRKGFLAVTGPSGTGKTMVLECVIDQIRARGIEFAYLFNPRMTVDQFFEFLAYDLDLQCESSAKSQILIALNSRLIERLEAGSTTALIIDDAHKLSPEVLEEIALFGNVESRMGKLLQVVFAGLPEFEVKLDGPEFRGLKNRVSVRAKLQPLSGPETSDYIDKRMAIAGMVRQDVIWPDLVAAIHEKTGGLPRLINAVCAGLLERCFRENRRRATHEMLEHVAAELGLED